METIWKPRPSWNPSQRPAAEIRNCVICRINLQTRTSRNHPQGDGKEGVVGSSPTEGLTGLQGFRQFLAPFVFGFVSSESLKRRFERLGRDGPVRGQRRAAFRRLVCSVRLLTTSDPTEPDRDPGGGGRPESARRPRGDVDARARYGADRTTVRVGVAPVMVRTRSVNRPRVRPALR
jgi:hypothetical protein